MQCPRGEALAESARHGNELHGTQGRCGSHVAVTAAAEQAYDGLSIATEAGAAETPFDRELEAGVDDSAIGALQAFAQNLHLCHLHLLRISFKWGLRTGAVNLYARGRVSPGGTSCHSANWFL